MGPRGVISPAMSRLPALLFLLLATRLPAASDSDLRLVPGGLYRPFYADPAEPGLPVAAFHLDRTPVTRGDFLAFVTARPDWRRSCVKRVFADADYLRDWAEDLDPGAGKLDLPVVNVSWFAARAYAKWRGARLPTMDEWEYAAAADETRVDARSDPAFRQRLLENFARIGMAELPRAGSVMTNLYGVTDLHGNVWEWVEDYNAVMFPAGAQVDEGSRWLLACGGETLDATASGDHAAYNRFAIRASIRGAFTAPQLGFRCALTPSRDAPRTQCGPC